MAIDQPLSTRPGKPALYQVADSNLRLYLAAGRSAQEQARRGRPDQAFRIMLRRWSTWRGKAVEPLVRQSLELAAAAGQTPWPQAEAVGGWWNRKFDPAIDLVGADRAPLAAHIYFTGSVKWLGSPFDHHDLAELLRGSAEVPGFTFGATGIAIASLSGVAPGVDTARVDLRWGPQDVVSAWRPAG